MKTFYFSPKHLIILTIITTIVLCMASCTKVDNDDDDESNQPPTCAITNPSEGDEFSQEDTISISADAEDADGSISEVRFYVDEKGVGSASEFPYNYEWPAADADTGFHIIKATAYDNEGGIISDEIEIRILEGGSGNIEMITVTGGTFDMGCTSEQNNCEGDEMPVHTVTLDDFEISKYEITNQQYANFMNEIGANSDGSYNGTEYLDIGDSQINYTSGQFIPQSGKENYPIIEVTWYGANAFCEYYGARLPTEAEWEFAARGGNSATPTRYAGSNNIDDVAWYSENSSSGPEKVGTKAANELGIYDMSGNVYEWCNDWYNTDYYSSSPQNNPQGPSSGSIRVLRGGSWGINAEYCRVAFRDKGDPEASYSHIGFRLALSSE